MAPVAKTITYNLAYSTITGENKCWLLQNLGSTNAPLSSTDNTEAASGWYSYYVQTLSNLQLIVDICSDQSKITPALITQGDPANQIAVAKIFQAVIFKKVVTKRFLLW